MQATQVGQSGKLVGQSEFPQSRLVSNTKGTHTSARLLHSATIKKKATTKFRGWNVNQLTWKVRRVWRTRTKVQGQWIIQLRK